MGAMEELVDHGRTGLLFAPGNAEDLVAKVSHFLDNPAVLKRSRGRQKDHAIHGGAELSHADVDL